MENIGRTDISISTDVKAPINIVWETWTNPEHITKWNQALEDWHSPYAENDVRTDGKFKTTMAAKDGSVSFDFEGIYINVEVNKLIKYEMPDGRKVKVKIKVWLY